jgi:hypothetical protein
LEVEKHHIILIIGPHVNKYMFQHVSKPNIHQNGPEILGVNVTITKKLELCAHYIELLLKIKSRVLVNAIHILSSLSLAKLDDG